jgi:XRE family aerobic/anaerobic benzoate catabolism transcriptional regulator
VSRLLDTLAHRVRSIRDSRGWTRQELAQRSGLSVRFLARVEAADGNISVLRLESLAHALDTSPDALLRPVADPSGLIALVGLRGAGKSTVGPLLAERLSVPFIEMDALIIETSGLALDQLFELHGERYYRRLERETLRRILARREPAVVAAAGGVVNEPVSWELLCERATVVWLRAGAEDHWSRVAAQGDHRPMADNPSAMDELRAILGARERIYAQANLVVDTGDRTPEEVAETVFRQLGALGHAAELE